MATLRVITSLESITVSQVSKVFLVKFLVMRIRMVRIAKSNVTARKMPNVIMKLVNVSACLAGLEKNVEAPVLVVSLGCTVSKLASVRMEVTVVAMMVFATVNLVGQDRNAMKRALMVYMVQTA